MTAMMETAPLRPRRGSAPAIQQVWQAVRATISRQFRDIGDAIYCSRARQAQREIARHLADGGMPMSDAAERELAAKLMRGDWNNWR